MELVYGKGLVGLMDPDTGKVDPKRFGKDRKIPTTNWIEIPTLDNQISGVTWEAFSFGYVRGVQYNGISIGGVTVGDFSNTVDTMSNCFFAVKGIIGQIEQLVYDFKNLGKRSGEYNWFNVAIFDPLHIIADLSVGYE